MLILFFDLAAIFCFWTCYLFHLRHLKIFSSHISVQIELYPSCELEPHKAPFGPFVEKLLVYDNSFKFEERSLISNPWRAKVEDQIAF